MRGVIGSPAGFPVAVSATTSRPPEVSSAAFRAQLPSLRIFTKLANLLGTHLQ